MKIKILLLIGLMVINIIWAVEIAPKSLNTKPAVYFGLGSLTPYFGHHHACQNDSTSMFGLRVSLLEFSLFPKNSRFGFGFKVVDVVSHFEYESYFSGIAPNISYVVYANQRSFHLLTAQISYFIDWFSYAFDYSYIAFPPLPFALNARLGRTKLFEEDYWGMQIAVGIQIGLGRWWVRE